MRAGTPAVAVATPPLLVVQIVEIRWTKATRGAPRANERALLPRSFGLVGCPQAPYVLQIWQMDEAAQFQPQLLQDGISSSIPGQQAGLLIGLPDTALDAITLGLDVAPAGGQPRRLAVREAIKLLPGETARLLRNARHASYSGQHYSETVYNVALGPGIGADRFTIRPPEHVFNQLADLF